MSQASNGDSCRSDGRFPRELAFFGLGIVGTAGADVPAMPGEDHEELLREVVGRQLQNLEDHLEQQGRSLRWWQRRSLAAVAACSDPTNGFALLRCADCDRPRVVPFTCGVRGLCGTCGGRVMSARAARWVDGLFPRVPVRQWVLTVPWPRRFLLAARPDLCREVLGVALGVVFKFISARCKAVCGAAGQTGSVTVVQRFSSSLSLNLHDHALVLDGGYVEHEDGSLSWVGVGAPTNEEVAAVAVEVATRIEALLARRGYPEDEAAELETEDDAELLGAAVAGRRALGLRAGRKTRSVKLLGQRPWRLPPRCAEHRGYNLHAGVVVQARDALERLCRYVNRPPLAKNRLTRRADGLLQLTLRRPWANGTTSFLFSELELAQRAVALLPPPRANQVLYHGVFGARARLRSRVVPKPEPAQSLGALRKQGEPRKTDRWTRWADLLARVFSVDPWACACGGRLLLHAVILPPASIDVLASLAKHARAPPSSPDLPLTRAPSRGHVPFPPTPHAA